MRHIEAIQVLRALAALAIVIHHGIFESIAFAALGGGSFTPPRLLPWPAGVDLFFVISGFVMVHSSQRLYGKPGAARQFLWRRAARIVPLYWATTALVLAAALLLPGAVSGAQPGLGLALASFAFIPMLRPDGVAQPVYSLGWTLNYEMFFYVVFALFLPLARPRAVAGTALALIGLTLFGLLVRPTSTALAFWSSPMVLLFVAGMGIATLRLEGIGLPLAARLALVAAALAILWLDPFGLTRDPLSITQTLDLTRVAAWGVPAALLVAAAALRPGDAAAKPASGARLEAHGGAGRSLLCALPHPSFRVPPGARDRAAARPFAVDRPLGLSRPSCGLRQRGGPPGALSGRAPGDRLSAGEGGVSEEPFRRCSA